MPASDLASDPAHDPASDLALLTGAARAAGEIARRFWRRGAKVWSKGAQGPVTEADVAVNDMLLGVLQAARPSYGWLSEETPDDTFRLATQRQFVVDPIDGTRAFIAGEETFAHALAVVEDGRVIAGVVYLPIPDRMYGATETGPALLNGGPIAVTDRAAVAGARMLTTSGGLAPAHWPGGVPPVKRAYRASIAWRMCLVAEGSFDGMLTLRDTWEWDIAAGALIAARAGAVVTDGTGAPLRFNAADPRCDGVIAASPGLHAGLMALRRGQDASGGDI